MCGLSVDSSEGVASEAAGSNEIVAIVGPSKGYGLGAVGSSKRGVASVAVTPVKVHPEAASPSGVVACLLALVKEVWPLWLRSALESNSPLNYPAQLFVHCMCRELRGDLLLL